MTVNSLPTCGLRRRPGISVGRLIVLCVALIGVGSAAQAQRPKYTMTIQGSGMGRGRIVSFPARIDCLLSDGPTSSGTCTAQFDSGTVITFVAEKDHPDVNFTGYSVSPPTQCGGGGDDCEIGPIDRSYTITAQFTPNKQYTLTVTVNGNGYGTVSQLDLRGTPPIQCGIQGTNQPVQCTASYWATTVARLEKTPGIQYASKGDWSGACTSDPCAIVMDGARAVTATFSSPAVTVGTSGGSGSGKVVGNGFDCTITPSSAQGTCFVTFPSPSQQTVTLTPQAAAGSVFAGWTVSGGSCPGFNTCVISPPAYYPPGTVVNARFNIDDRSISVSGTGSGTVKSGGGEINCTLTVSVATGSCNATFTPGASVTLTAAPANGWQFGQWGGACATSTTPMCNLQLTASQNVTVTFTRMPMTLTIAGSGTGEGTVASTSPAGLINCTIKGSTVTDQCSGQVPFETNVTLTATPANSNSTFESWSLASCTGTGPCVVPMTSSQTITARFRGIDVPVTILGTGSGGDGLVTAPDGMSCRITKGIAASTGCSTTASAGTPVMLTAVPQNGSVFGTWSPASCPATSLTCAVTTTQPISITVGFTAPPPVAQLIDVLLNGTALSPAFATELDKFGNNDKTFNLGDLLALLDRTGEAVSPALLARIAELEHRQPHRPSPRRGVP